MTTTQFSSPPTNVAELLSRVPAGGFVVVGGQAVNAFAELYIDCDEQLRAQAPFASKDLDVFATRGVMLNWAKTLGPRAKVITPDPDQMNAVQTGILRYELQDGRDLKVDFMTTVFGVKKKKKADEDAAIIDSAVSVTIEGATPVEVPLLNPVLTVQSRVANVVGLPHLYDNDHGRKQLRAAIASCRHFLEELAGGSPREALNHVKKLFEIACSPHALKVYDERGIDVFAACPHPDVMPDAFREKRHPQMLAELAKRQGKRA